MLSLKTRKQDRYREKLQYECIEPKSIWEAPLATGTNSSLFLHLFLASSQTAIYNLGRPYLSSLNFYYSFTVTFNLYMICLTYKQGILSPVIKRLLRRENQFLLIKLFSYLIYIIFSSKNKIKLIKENRSTLKMQQLVVVCPKFKEFYHTAYSQKHTTRKLSLGYATGTKIIQSQLLH